MERSHEARIWRRSAAAGFLALALSVGGAIASSGSAAAPSCRARAPKSGSEWLLEHLMPRVTAPPLVTKIARAAIAYAFGTCA